MTEIGKLVGILYYSGKAVASGSICRNLKISTDDLTKLITKANTLLEPAGLFVMQSENELQLTLLSEYTQMIEEFYEVTPQSLSQASLEVLSIVAYKQPIAKSGVDEIRGVSSDQSLRNLLNKGLIKRSQGKREPEYRTTSEFLRLSGLKSLKELENGQTEA